MKKSLILILYAFLGLACIQYSCISSSRQAANQPISSNLVLDRGDDEEHELIIIDNNFDRWFRVNSRPVSYYSLSYYESQNRRYVAAWNSLASSMASANSPFEQQINYDYAESYGLELNYKLFWYFRYIEDVYGQRYNFPN